MVRETDPTCCDASGPHLQTAGVWSARAAIIQQPLDIEMAPARCPRDVPACARTDALERRVRAAGARRRRRLAKTTTGCSSPSVSGHPQTRAPRVQHLYLQSLEACGIDLGSHDVRFEEDNWNRPRWVPGHGGRCIRRPGDHAVHLLQQAATDLSPISVELTTASSGSPWRCRASTTSSIFNGRRA